MSRPGFHTPTLRVISCILLVALSMGCAQANSKGIQRYRGLRMPAPRGIVVYDFEPTADSVGLETGRTVDQDGDSEEALANRREVGRVLADVLAKELEERGIPTSQRSGTIEVPEGVMAIGGQIVTVDDGSAAKRIMIGFGSGRSRLTSLGQLYGYSKSGPIRVWEYQNTAASGAKPGILTTLPIGIAVQGVTLLVLLVNGGLSTMGELSSTSTANAKRMAKEMADAVEETFRRITIQR
jgi:hypothetical protein